MNIWIVTAAFSFFLVVRVSAQTRESLAKDPNLFLSATSRVLKWNEPAEPVRIVGPIYFVGTVGLGAYLITGDEGHILLYTGMPQSGPMIESSIRKIGFKPEDIKVLLTGHAHIDHAGGHANLKKISGAEVALMKSDKELLESGGKTDFHYGSYPGFYYEPVKVEKVLHSGSVIKLGDLTMKALHTPGHTRGATTWIIDVFEEGKIYHVVFPDGTSINPGYRIAKEPSYKGIEKDFRKTFKILESLKPDIWLASHTEMFDFTDKRSRALNEGVQAWVDPEGYVRFVADQRHKFESQIKEELEVSGKTN